MAHRSNNPDEKWCVQGQHFAPRSSFARNRTKSDGLQGSCRDCDSRRTTIFSRQKRTNVTQEMYDKMLERQQGRCAGCGRHTSETLVGQLCADHNHATGEPRGLLCQDCNKALGLVKDDPSILGNLIVYLRR